MKISCSRNKIFKYMSGVLLVSIAVISTISMFCEMISKSLTESSLFIYIISFVLLVFCSIPVIKMDKNSKTKE